MSETIRKLGKYELDNIRLTSDSPSGAVDFLAAQEPRSLAVMIVNHVLNGFITSYDNDNDYRAIPYQGWYWRSVDFFTDGGVTIADGDGQVAVCENNKWGYPQRGLTEDEQARFLTLVWDAYLESRKGGLLSEIKEKTVAALGVAGDYIGSLTIKKESN